MAKAKKGKLTIEDALVPVDEQPYEIPENWCWVKPLAVFNIEYGKGLPTKELTEDGYPVFGANGQIGYYSEYMFEEEMALMSCRGAYSGTMNCSLPFSYVTSNSLVMKDKGCFVSPRFIYYMYSALNTDKLVSGSAQPQVTVQAFNDYAIPLPPLEEQKRIVEQIENLFAKLDEAKKILLDVQQNYKLQKQSLLQESFSGNLTKEWRLQNEVSFEQSWAEKCLDEVCASIYDGDHMPPPKSDSGVHFLVISNVNTGHLSFEDTRFVPEEYYEKLTDTRKPQVGDVLYTLVGSYGIPVIVDDERPFCFQRHMGLLKPRAVDTNFLWYQLQTQEFFDKATSIANGTAQLTVPIKGLRKLTIKCPSLEEQLEIVRILDDLMDKQDLIKDTVDEVLNKIEVMKKSILAKAFRGELGTNIADEESSIELLKQIISE